jgi:hypothetical protein
MSNIIQGKTMTEKPKRKNKKPTCPHCGYREVLTNPTGQGEGTFGCRVCGVVWDGWGNQTEASLDGNLAVLKRRLLEPFVPVVEWLNDWIVRITNDR